MTGVVIPTRIIRNKSDSGQDFWRGNGQIATITTLAAHLNSGQHMSDTGTSTAAELRKRFKEIPQEQRDANQAFSVRVRGPSLTTAVASRQKVRSAS